MARLALCVLGLLVAGALSLPDPTPGLVDQVQHQPVPVSVHDLENQRKILLLFFHPHEPDHVPEHQEIINTWDLNHNVALFENSTAVLISAELIKNEWLVPKGMPFSILEPTHEFQVVTFFNLLVSAKTFDTFWKTAVYLRAHINEHIFVYVLSTAIYHRHDCEGFIVPPLYEVFPSFFNNGEVMTAAQRITTHGKHWVKHYPNTYVWDENVVIRWNSTVWPYHSKDMPVTYFTHDYELNNFYYNMHLLYPFWLGGEVSHLIKDRRGEWFWFMHKQLLARYYMERLSNGLGEIPVLSHDVVEDGYTSGLLTHSGISYPVRPNYFQLWQPCWVNKITESVAYENRIREAIDRGYIVTPTGEHVDIHSPDAIDVLGRIVEANVDSPNNQYYKDFISIWKMILGNSIVQEPYYWKGIPWVLPSALEQYQTTLRDPAFYMIWKRVLHLFDLWHEKLPPYKKEELGLPGVEIEKVEADKMVTYFEYTYMNVTNHLHLNEVEAKHVFNNKSVLVQHARLNHKVFNVRLHVKTEAPKNVVVRLFLAPKYDSQGKEIPLPYNSHNFFQFDQFTYALTQGENVITRSSNDNPFFVKDLTSAYKWYDRIEKALETKEPFMYTVEKVDAFPHRLLLPKGRVGGMPFVLLVHISEFHAPNVLYGTGFNHNLSLGVGSGARRLTSDPLGFPVDRPLHDWQVKGLKNIWFEEVLIHHKHTPEVDVTHVE